MVDIDSNSAVNRTQHIELESIAGSNFPVPFTKEQLREDILRVYVLQLRVTGLVTGSDHVWAVTGKQSPSGGNWFDWEAEQAALTHADIAGSPLAQALEQQYDYGFLGIEHMGVDGLEYESIHMWIADYVMDMSSSLLVEQWGSYGDDVKKSIDRCLHTCELANARVVLEDGEPFSHFHGVQSDRGEGAAYGDLTIRQMALLAGMEEMSIRTAVSRKGPNVLQTYKNERINRTLVKPEVAKAWLIAKGRYLPIKQEWAGGTVDLKNLKVTGTYSLSRALHDQVGQIKTREQGQRTFLRALGELFKRYGLEEDGLYSAEIFKNSCLLTEVAQLLELDASLLALRARQALLMDQLEEVQQALQSASSADKE